MAELDPCGQCGAAILDSDDEKHRMWHERLDELFDVIVENVENINGRPGASS